MTQSDYGTGDEPLTDLERQRLRPSVDVAALEQWLAVSRGELRRAVVVHFATEVTEQDLLAVRRATGATDEELAALATPVDDLDATLVREPAADSPTGARAFRFIPSWQPVVTVLPPDDPALREAWNAIEPEGPRVETATSPHNER